MRLTFFAVLIFLVPQITIGQEKNIEDKRYGFNLVIDCISSVYLPDFKFIICNDSTKMNSIELAKVINLERNKLYKISYQYNRYTQAAKNTILQDN
jgi:hypothetical protein